MSWAELSWANLSRTDLSGADLSWANLFWTDLSGADLSRANLYGANLYGANLYGEKLDKNPIQLLGLKYPILITKLQIFIGCEKHKVEEWKKFTDEEISEIDDGALDWWNEWKDTVFMLNKKHCE